MEVEGHLSESSLVKNASPVAVLSRCDPLHKHALCKVARIEGFPSRVGSICGSGTMGKPVSLEIVLIAA